MKSAIIVNPKAGGGRVAHQWGLIRDEVNSRLGGVEELLTKAPQDATRFAKQVAESGEYDLLIIAGGDGSINEAVNGLLNSDSKTINPKLNFGILSAGRGCDFIKTVGIPGGYREALAMFKNYRTIPCDVGLCVFRDEFGREQHRHFINIATAGIAGLVAKKVARRSGSLLPPGLVYFGSSATTFLTFKGQKVKVSVDGKEVFNDLAMNVFVANGSYSGAGMCWAPKAKVDDGLFDVIAVEPLSKLKLVTASHKLYDGTFQSLPEVHTFKGREVTIESPEEVLLEMDGEQPGLTPAAFKVVPQALNLVVPA